MNDEELKTLLKAQLQKVCSPKEAELIEQGILICSNLGLTPGEVEDMTEELLASIEGFTPEMVTALRNFAIKTGKGREKEVARALTKRIKQGIKEGMAQLSGKMSESSIKLARKAIGVCISYCIMPEQAEKMSDVELECLEGMTPEKVKALREFLAIQ